LFTRHRDFIPKHAPIFGDIAHSGRSRQIRLGAGQPTTLRLAQLSRTKEAQHGHVTGIRISASVGVHDIDDPVALARHLPCAGMIATGIQARLEASSMMAKMG
jgi:hypothetical protein